ncbi:S-adenosyl-L-methionine-dependent methyltransferase [Cucurbitaria berberidis CBS 394.84]|uniref:S-adenosyl-L-methionine-dependent methyltransferase n=1 Tax=Cucurbitaria berberidis CBS 394.84 TaxID=1168544 RepID=A0A9P4GHE7_9PLEO|nr:S-adenosyl-L-methionine-dependent methyltransferase [Cucurbitaria berberidis CBS 394.84]KAF1845261.1 S-adenosyl-L-methionine-dependent methyltransferase [Cucurbitaria berberidis CBS 394.84]
MKDSYDAIAETYAAQFTTADDPIRLDYLKRLVSQLQLTGRDAGDILELGCGAGVPATKFLLQMDNPTVHVTGNDISTSQLDRARSNLAQYGKRLTLVEGDMLSLSFPNDSFDAVTGFYSIIHLPRDEQTELMHKIVQWLKPGGLFLANFSATEFSSQEAENWLGQDKGWMFWSGWGEEKSVKMVADVGLNVIVKELRQATGDAKFLWVLARKNNGQHPII